MGYCFFFFFATLGLSWQHANCSMWDLVPWPGMETTPPALAARNLTYRTTSTVVAKDGEKPLVTKALQGQLTVPLQYQCTIDNLVITQLVGEFHFYTTIRQIQVLRFWKLFTTGGTQCRKNTKLSSKVGVGPWKGLMQVIGLKPKLHQHHAKS